MRKRYVPLGIASALLVVASAVYIFSGLQLYQGYQGEYPDWTSATGPCGALITWSPPTILYTGLYVNQPSLLTLRYRSLQPQTLSISVSIPQFTQEQSIRVEATPVFQSQAFKPPLLNESVLDALVGPGQRMAELRLHIENSNNVVCDISANILLKSRQWMQWYDARLGVDNSRYLAGWVTPHAAAILKLLGATTQWIESHPSNYPGLPALIGYNAEATQRQVSEQVDAIFDTLQFEYHLTYRSDSIPFMEDSTQLIQLPSDILDRAYPTGMCVETTAIMASAVESLGMRPYFIIVPGHAFLGVALDSSVSGPIGYWETSWLSAGITGEQANVYGDKEFTEKQNQMLDKIDVQFERQQGIMPIE